MSDGGCVVTVTRSDTTDGKYLDFASATANGIDISSAGTYKLKKGTTIICTIKSGKTADTAYVKFNGSTVASCTGNSIEGAKEKTWSFTLESDTEINFAVYYEGDVAYMNTSNGTITITTT